MKCRAFRRREARFRESPKYSCKKGNMFNFASGGIGGRKYWVENGGKVDRVKRRVER